MFEKTVRSVCKVAIQLLSWTCPSEIGLDTSFRFFRAASSTSLQFRCKVFNEKGVGCFRSNTDLNKQNGIN